MRRDDNAAAGRSGPGASPVLAMSYDERLKEVAHIVALGLKRLRARQSRRKPKNQSYLREFGLDFALDRSGHGSAHSPLEDKL